MRCHTLKRLSAEVTLRGPVIPEVDHAFCAYRLGDIAEAAVGLRTTKQSLDSRL